MSKVKAKPVQSETKAPDPSCGRCVGTGKVCDGIQLHPCECTKVA